MHGKWPVNTARVNAYAYAATLICFRSVDRMLEKQKCAMLDLLFLNGNFLFSLFVLLLFS